MEPCLVTLQLCIHLDDNTYALYLRPNTPLLMPPQIGTFIVGWNIPAMRGAPDDVSTIIRAIVLDDVQKMIMVAVQGCHMSSMDAKEMLAHLGDGWILSRVIEGPKPEPVAEAAPPAPADEPPDDPSYDPDFGPECDDDAA